MCSLLAPNSTLYFLNGTCTLSNLSNPSIYQLKFCTSSIILVLQKVEWPLGSVDNHSSFQTLSSTLPAVIHRRYARATP